MTLKHHTADEIAALQRKTQQHLEDRERIFNDERGALPARAGESADDLWLDDPSPSVFFIECHVGRLHELADDLILYDVEAAEAIEHDILALLAFTYELQAHNRRKNAVQLGNAAGLEASREPAIQQLADTTRRRRRIKQRKQPKSSRANPLMIAAGTHRESA